MSRLNNKLEEPEHCRLDIWLFRTRLVKSRKIATKLITSGRIRLSRGSQVIRVKKAHQVIRPGQSVTFMYGAKLLNVEMISAGTRRGPAPEAQRLYRVLTSEAIDAKSRP